MAEQSFARMFRTSKFTSMHAPPPPRNNARIHPGTSNQHQLLTTSRACRAEGEWGLKHTLPRTLNHHVLRALRVDEPSEKKPVYASAGYLYTQVHRWRENMLAPVKPFPLPVTPAPVPLAALDYLPSGASTAASLSIGTSSHTSSPKYLGDMSRREYARLLVRAKHLAPVWRRLVDNGVYAPQDWHRFLNVSCEPIAPFDSKDDGASFSHPPTYKLREMATLSSMASTSTSSSFPSSNTDFVRGRILNKLFDDNNHCVGVSVAVSGFIAFCHNSEIVKNQLYSQAANGTRRNSLLEFKVVDARIDHLGRPDIQLALRDKGGIVRSGESTPTTKRSNSRWNEGVERTPLSNSSELKGFRDALFFNDK